MVTPLLTKTVQMALDGTPTIEISPVDKSIVSTRDMNSSNEIWFSRSWSKDLNSAVA